MSELFDGLERGVLVVGSGPAGSSAAATLAQLGVPVTLVDRQPFPREKICGDGISPLALEGLLRLGFDLDSFAHLEAARRCDFVSPAGHVWHAHYPARDAAAGPSEHLDHGFVIARREFDAALLEHARRSGARVVQPCRYRSISSDGEGWRVSLRVGEAELECRPRAIIAADGEHSSLRRDLSGSRRRAEEWLAVRAYLGGLSEPVPQMSFHFTRDVLPGYGWVFPAGSQEGGFRANAGVYVHSERLRRGGHSLKELFRRFVEPLVESPSAPLHGARLESEPQGYPITPYNPARRLVFRNALLAGDAAGVADPLTGEGIGPAILSGRLAAEAAARFVSSGAAIDLLRYADELKRALDPTRRRGRFLLYLLERHSWLVDRLFVRAESDRRLADRVFRVLSGDLPLRRVFRPSVFLRIYWPGLFR